MSRAEGRDRYGVTAGAVGDLRRAASDAPTDAETTSAIPPSSRTLRPWLSTMNPASAATAGSRLISTPNTCVAIRRSASSSSEYGIAEERIDERAAFIEDDAIGPAD